MKTSLRNVLVGVLWIALFAPLAWADEASHRAAADELLDAMKLKEVQLDAAKQMLDIMVKQNPILEANKDILEETIKKALAWDAIKDDYAKVYMEEFTEPELKKLAAFYRTPLGRKLAKKTPVLAAKGAKIGAAQMRKYAPELKRKLRERLSGGSM